MTCFFSGTEAILSVDVLSMDCKSSSLYSLVKASAKTSLAVVVAAYEHLNLFYENESFLWSVAKGNVIPY